jgi:Rrf2 family transcriptional regulator, iron-sulfur cluster assembly transcription factor
MVFSKSFGYAVRGMLYVAMLQNEKRYVQAGEIASRLAVPRHFMGKIMKMLVKERLLVSSKGPLGGFTLHQSSLGVPLIKILEITEGPDFFKRCVLSAKECNASSPCPLHHQMITVRLRLESILSGTTISDLLNGSTEELIRSIANTEEESEIIFEERNNMY